METTRRVNVYETNYQCPKCNAGHMIRHHENNSLAYYVNFLHKCNICGYEMGLPSQYPIYTFKEVKKRCRKKDSLNPDSTEDLQKKENPL